MVVETNERRSEGGDVMYSENRDNSRRDNRNDRRDNRNDSRRDNRNDSRRDNRNDSRRDNRNDSRRRDNSEDDNNNNQRCSFCNEEGHVATNGANRTKLIQYYACKKFCDLTPARRFQELCAKGFCFQCLYPGAKKRDGRHATGNCQSLFVCQHESHAQHQCKKHVLVCQDHCEEENNINLLNQYKERFIQPQRRVEQFSRDIQLSFVTHIYRNQTTTTQDHHPHSDPNCEPPIRDSAIYMLQSIMVENKAFTLFFDTGCKEFVSRHEAIQRLSNARCTQVEQGPIDLGGIGDMRMTSSHGRYEVKLPLASGKDCSMSGVCLDKITTNLPTYPLKGDIERDIHKAYKSSGKSPKELPALFQSVGGDVDFMIGSQYLREYPNQIFKLPSGLTIYESPFLNPDGSRGVIGGPHPLISLIDYQHWRGDSANHITTYLSQQYQLYRLGFQVNPDCCLLVSKPSHELDTMDDNNLHDNIYTVRQKLRNFEAAENAGSVIDYRCPDCHGCTKCKNSEQINKISMENEAEQREIEKSVSVDTEAGVTTAFLPLLHDPVIKLSPNKQQAMAIYKRELRKLDRSEKAKNDVLKAELKLQEREHVEYEKNLNPKLQEMLKSSPIQNFIPWHIVYNTNSVTTDVRLVFNFSHSTPSGYSLNDLLAKGRNNMNKLPEIQIRWRTQLFAFHTDIEQMYPSLNLDPKHWSLQRYLFHNELNPNKDPEEKALNVQNRCHLS